MKILQAYILFIVLLLFGCSGNDADKLVEFHGSTMGTTYSIKVVDSMLAGNNSAKERLKTEIDSILKQVNNQMSTWQKDSEISLFNNSKSTEWFSVSPDFVSVISDAQKISEISNGALDITVGRLVNLWGFGPSIKEDKIPSESEILAAKNLCGYKKISFRKEEPAIKKDLADMYLDLSSIAKGFGVDKVANYLLALDYKDYMVEIGGEVRTSGKNHLGENWRIGISVPDGSFEIEKIIALNNLAVATSGDYRNYFEKDGVRYSHTINPRTGKPITHSLASVTVIYKNCTMADGLATAIDVLGPDEGFELAVKEKLPVFLIVKTENGFQEKMTPEFKELFKIDFD